MVINKQALNTILNTDLKLKIIRLYASRREDYTSNGREIARKTGFSAPATHTALKDLYSQGILKRSIIGKQHLYRLNTENRIVKEILIPTFKKELSIKEDVSDFIRSQIIDHNIDKKISSIYLYGSFIREKKDKVNDVDLAVIVTKSHDKDQVEKIFLEKISGSFYNYFDAHLDVYLKSKTEFINKVKKQLPPVSELIKSYSVVYGKDIAELN